VALAVSPTLTESVVGLTLSDFSSADALPTISNANKNKIYREIGAKVFIKNLFFNKRIKRKVIVH
jgi:hypothetical protein